MELAQAWRRPNNRLFYYHPKINENKIKFLQKRLNNVYKKLKEVGNNNIYFEFKRYKEKYDSDVKDA